MDVFTINNISLVISYSYNAISVNENKSIRVDDHLIYWQPMIYHDIFFALSKDFVELTLPCDITNRWTKVYCFVNLHIHLDFRFSHLVSEKCARNGGGQRFWNFFHESNSF